MNDEMNAAVGKARKAPTGPARAPPVKRQGRHQPTSEIHRLGADPGAEQCVLDHLVARLPSTHADAPKGIQTENPTSKTGGYEGFVQAVVDAVRGVRKAPLTGEDSLQVLKVIFAAYRSSETGTVQKVR